MLDLIAEHKDIVKAFQVFAFEQEGSLFRFKAELTLVDDSKIFVKEYVFENREKKICHGRTQTHTDGKRWNLKHIIE